MVRYDLANLILFAGKPRAIASKATGFFWFPGLWKFATGQYLLTVSLNDDSNNNEQNAQAAYLSTDGGQTFPVQQQWDVNGFQNAGGEPRVSLPDGSIVGTSTYLKPYPNNGQYRVFSAHRWTYDRGGQRVSVEPWAAIVSGFPADVQPWTPLSRTWWAHINWFGDIVVDPFRGRWVSTISLTYQGDALTTTVAVGSYDQGRTWTVLGTIAGPSSVPGATEGFDEASTVLLNTGELMCVSRVGGGLPMWRAYSSDGGVTWTAPDALGMKDISPRMVRVSSGVLALASRGNSGVELFFSLDPRGAASAWQEWDVLAHHNAQAALCPADVQHIDVPGGVATTSYTALLEASCNRLFLVYDRLPSWRSAQPNDGHLGANEVYLVEVAVVRTDGVFA